MKMNLKEKQELLAKFLIQHCNIDYDARCVPICVTSSHSDIDNCYLGDGCWRYALRLIYVNENNLYTSSGELCAFDVDERNEDINAAISDALDGVKDYYATHYRKFKSLSWTKLKNIVETEPPTNSNVRH